VNRHYFSKIEFYITNVCNLNCNGCNRFNNYKFSGSQRWVDYESVYAKWSEYIDIDQIVILGGEPLLNPDLLNWISGIRKIFKSTKNLQVLSNGTQLNKVKGLYDRLNLGRDFYIGISWHNANNVDELESNVRDFLKGSITRVEKDNRWGADFAYIDQYGIGIPVWMENTFYSSAINLTDQGTFTLHNSNPLEAHSSCGFARHKNYHFIRGQLYKCGPVALFPEFDQQHQLDITSEDRTLLNSYRPLTVDNYLESGTEFISQLDQPLPQCKFCPVDRTTQEIFAVKKNLA
jgi:hypothetical protein